MEPHPLLTMAWPDLLVIGVYLVGIVGLGLWAWGKRKRKQHTSAEYFLAGSALRWPVIGLALFSTNISTTHLVSLAQEGYVNGLAYGNFEWMAAFLLIVLSLFFAPFYIRSRVATLPDFLEKRYSRASRDWLAALSIVSAVFIHIGFTLYTGAVVLKGLFGIDIGTSIVLTALLTGLYTIVGGLLAVVLTESAQTIILIVGSGCVLGFGLAAVGGWSGLAASVEPVKLTILRTAAETPSLPWYSVFLGYPIIGLWYWCADQTIVQRVLGARDERQARLGPLFAGFIKILPVFLFVLPGLIAYGLVRQGRLAAPANSADIYSVLINRLLPVGIKGIVAAALLAALMSTVSGALNSIATLFTLDFYKRWKPRATERRLTFVGRLVTFIAMLAAILWSPLVSHFPSIFQGIVSVICYIAPPITAVFIWGVFWRKASSAAAYATLSFGSGLGLIVFFLDWFKDKTGWNVPSMLATFYLFVLCSAILVIVSLIKPHIHTAESEKLVWSSPMEAVRGKLTGGAFDYRFVSAVLFITMVVLYVLFG
ncbi:MAG: sodium:solute symporter [Candidatus Aminicenantales bacterium]